MNIEPMLFRMNPWVDRELLPPFERRFFGWFDQTVLFFLGNACNLKCVYCFKPKSAPAVQPLDVIAEQVRRTAAAGFRRAILSGGEPTIYPHLDAVLGLLRQSGFEAFGIQSNGLKLADPAFVDHLVDAGMRFCHVSFDSPDPSTQNTMAHSAKAFDAVQAALHNLAHHPEVTVHIKAVITSINQAHVAGLVALLTRLKAETGLQLAVTLTPMVPVGSTYDAINVRYRGISSALRDAIDAGRRDGIATYYHHVPYCVMDGRTRESIDHFVRDAMLRPDGTLDEETMYEKGESCAGCELNSVCQGYPGQYAALFGNDTFEPIGAPPRPAPTPAGRLARRSYAVSARLVVGTVRAGAPEYFSYRSIVRRLEQVASSSAERVVIAGPEPLRHPVLPQVVTLLAERGHEVWVETIGVALSRMGPIETLVGCGLRGVRWLHLPASSAAYEAQLGKALSPDVVSRTGLVLAKAGVAVEHVFLVGEEPVQLLRARVEGIRRQPFERFNPGQFRLSVVPFEERWSTGLGLVGVDEGHAASVARDLDGWAVLESGRLFRTVRAMPD